MNNDAIITILVVDDDAAVRYATIRLLQQAGYTVTEAASGEEALQKVAETPPDLIILDVNMPDMSGFEVSHRLKAKPATTSIPIMHLSATAIEDIHIVTGLDIGADMYLRQPVDPQVLLASVRALLRVRIAERKQAQLLHALTLTERRLRIVVENTSTQFAFLDRDLRFVWVNTAFARRCHCQPDDLIGKSCANVFPPDGMRDLLEQAWESGKSVAFHEAPFPCSDDSEFGPTYWDWTIFPILGETGVVEGLVLSFNEVTESVRERERALAKERARAELAETLVQEMSHRVKNNLTMVAGILQAQTIEEQDERITNALREATNRLLTFAHLHEQIQETGEANINLLQAVEHIAETARATSARSSVAISVQGEPVTSDAKTAVNIAVVVNELITNAIKHGAPGASGTLEVNLSLRLFGEQLHLSVWNSGNPVPESPQELRERRGLGLQLVQALVSGHSGFFTLTPERGGSKARVNFRLSPSTRYPHHDSMTRLPGQPE